MEIIEDISYVQSEWNKMLKNNYITKKQIIELVKPFRDKYNLTDKQALQIARSEVNLEIIISWLKEKYK